MAARRHPAGESREPLKARARSSLAMRVGIVGGGLMGLAVADRLSGLGHAVEVFERAPQVGGLATWQDFGPFVWDRFYHVILPSDSALLGFLRSIGLGDEVRWHATQTGYYVDHQFHPLSNNLDFLKFPPLGLWSKFRLAATILYCSRVSDWRRLEQVPLEDFLVRTSGRATFEKFWKPLLLAKLGVHYRRVSAVFIWSYIKRLFSARDATAQKEQLGHVSGGYRRVFETLTSRIRARGGAVEMGVTVENVVPGNDAGIEIRINERARRFDKVVFTGPVNVMRQVVDPRLVEVPTGGRDVEYLGVICMALVTRRALMPYYILNIGDPNVPFTGVIGMSNLVALEETAGLHLTYLPKYVLSTDPLLNAPDGELTAQFLPAVHQMFPALQAADIVSAQLHRAVKVQPLQVLGYSQLVQSPRTRHPAFYVLNTSQFVNNTLNNNEVIRTVNDFFASFGPDFAAAVAQVAPAAATSAA